MEIGEALRRLNASVPFEVAEAVGLEIERLYALELRARAVQDAWPRARDDKHLPQGFGWPGDLYDALEAL